MSNFRHAHSLLTLAKNGSINFTDLVATLSTDGYVVEGSDSQKNGLGFGSWNIEAATQEDFDVLFKEYMPDKINDICLARVATSKGYIYKSAFTYALFNSKIIGRDQVERILIRRNAEEDKDFDF